MMKNWKGCLCYLNILISVKTGSGINLIEGIHYKWAGEPWNSEIFMTPLDMIPVKYRGEVL